LNHKKLTVTALSIILRVGKTTLLNGVLRNCQNLKVALFVNDVSKVNIDAAFEKDLQTLSHTKEKLIEISHGCICCTLLEDLMQEVEKLAKENR
jgi:G3E family GTPase